MALPPPDPQFVLRGTSAAVYTLHFSCGGQEPDVPILFSGSQNGFIHVWNLKTHRVDTTLDGHGRKSVYCVETMGGKNRLLSQGRDQRICLWDLAEGRASVTDSVFTENVGFCRCSLLKVAQGRWLMAMAAKALEEVQVLELPSKTSVCTLKPEVGAKLGMPMCLKLWQLSCGSQPLLLAGYEDGSVVLWNLSMGKASSQLGCHQEPVMSLDFDSEKAKGISGSSEKVLSIWSLNEQQNLQIQPKDFSLSTWALVQFPLGRAGTEHSNSKHPECPALPTETTRGPDQGATAPWPGILASQPEIYLLKSMRSVWKGEDGIPAEAALSHAAPLAMHQEAPSSWETHTVPQWPGGGKMPFYAYCSPWVILHTASHCYTDSK